MSTKIDSSITYAALITNASNFIINQINNHNASGTIQINSSSNNITISGNSIVGPVTRTLTNVDYKTYNANSVTAKTIQSDLTNFMKSLNIPTDNSTVTPTNLASFLFALNYFIEKALVKTKIGNSYKLSYFNPNPSHYSKFNLESVNNTIDNQRIQNVYSQLSSTDMMTSMSQSVGTTSAALSSSSCSSSCSSSSCSSSCSSSSCSSSSSWFIAFFNI